MTHQELIGPHLKRVLAAQDRPLSATQINHQTGYPASTIRQALTYLHFLGERIEYHRPKRTGSAGLWSLAANAPSPPELLIEPLPKHGGIGITDDDLAWMAKYRARAKDRARRMRA